MTRPGFAGVNHLLLIISLLWLMLGAPIFPAEWHSLPITLLQRLQQLPLRLQRILAQWIR